MGIASAEKPRRTGIEDVVVAVAIEQPACGQVPINGFAVIFRIEWSLGISAMINKRRAAQTQPLFFAYATEPSPPGPSAMKKECLQSRQLHKRQRRECQSTLNAHP